MKSLFPSVCAAFLLVGSSYGQDTQASPSAPQAGTTEANKTQRDAADAVTEGVMMKGGKMMVMKGGQSMAMTEDMTMPH